MDKFIKVDVGSDERLIKVSGIAKIVKDGVAPTTETDVTYLNGEAIAITHAAVSGEAFVVALGNIIAKALATDWTKPVYDATDDSSLAAISAIA